MNYLADKSAKLEASGNAEVTQALASIYVALYKINLVSDTYQEIQSMEHVGIAMEKYGRHDKCSQIIMDTMVSLAADKYKRAIADFVNLDTIKERMKDDNSISIEFVGNVSGWCRAKFVVLERDEYGNIVEVIYGVQDIDKDKAREQDLLDKLSYASNLAYKDGLTGVNNRMSYNEHATRLNSKIKEGIRDYAIAVFDVNGLKFVNDNFGHENGNMLLVDACRCICRAFSDCEVFRIGGDEFVALISNPKGYGIEHYEEGLNKFISNVNEMYKNGYYVSIAMGYASLDEEEVNNFEELFDIADHRMYDIKQEMKLRPENSWMWRKDKP